MAHATAAELGGRRCVGLALGLPWGGCSEHALCAFVLGLPVGRRLRRHHILYLFSSQQAAVGFWAVGEWQWTIQWLDHNSLWSIGKECGEQGNSRGKAMWRERDVWVYCVTQFALDDV